MSILPDIQHPLTSLELASLNQALDDLLQSNPIDDLTLQKIIDKRANLVESLLTTMDEHTRRCFAAYELKSNDKIIESVNALRSVSKIELEKVSRASKAIKKYHQV